MARSYMQSARILAVLAGAALVAVQADASPKFNRGHSMQGVTVYQDHAEPRQFYYVPTSVDLVMGETLKDFKVTHWGVGRAYFVEGSDGMIRSRVGGVLAGRAVFDITDGQRRRLYDEVKRVFKIDDPQILRLHLKTVEVKPVLAQNTLGISAHSSDIVFPAQVQVGSDFEYLIGTGNSLFAHFVANASTATQDFRIQPNPQFGISVVGEAEFVGEPWKAKVTADLRQVWSEVRKRASVGIRFGWFSLGSATYQSIVQDLIREKIINVELEEGSLDNEKHGRQIFEMARAVLEAVNAQATAGDGFFKFEPLPQAADPGGGGSGGLFGWGVSINAGYSEARLTQTIKFEQTFSYTGRFMAKVPMSMALSVNCSPATQHLFSDLREPGVPCVTQQKVDTMSERLGKEMAAKNRKILELAEKYAMGQITEAQYDRLMKLYTEISFTEDLRLQPPVTDKEAHGVLSVANEKARYTNLTDADIRELEARAMEGE